MNRAFGVVVLLAACTNDRTAELEGTWTFAAGATDVDTCDSGIRTNDLAGFHFTLAAGSDAPLVMSEIIGAGVIAGWPPGCGLEQLDVNGGTASTAAGAQCTYGMRGYSVTSTYSMTLALDAAGTSLTVRGNADDVSLGANPDPCSQHSIQGTATR